MNIPRAPIYFAETPNPRCKCGGAAPGIFASALRMRDAYLPRSEKSLALAGMQWNLGIPDIARQMRRFFGPRGGAARRMFWRRPEWLRNRMTKMISSHGPRTAKQKKNGGRNRGLRAEKIEE